MNVIVSVPAIKSAIILKDHLSVVVMMVSNYRTLH